MEHNRNDSVNVFLGMLLIGNGYYVKIIQK